MENIHKECISIITSIIAQQRAICSICTKLYGEDAVITKEAKEKLNKYVAGFHKYKNKCN